MNYEKETYLNTEEIRESYRREGAVRGALAAGCKAGGVRFYTSAQVRISAEVLLTGETGEYVIALDGVPLSSKKAPYSLIEATTAKGEHCFEILSNGDHGGATFSVSGVSVKRGAPYLSFAGGAYNGNKLTAFVKRGDRITEKYEYDSGNLIVSERTEKYADMAYAFDKTQNAYTVNAATLSVSRSNDLTFSFGGSFTRSLNSCVGASLIDGSSLPVGAAFLAAYLEEEGTLRFILVDDSGVPILSDTVIEGVSSVKSAARGSAFLISSSDGTWKMLSFGETGENSVVAGSYTMPYSERLVVRSKGFEPSVDLRGGSFTPTFYCKNASNLLVRRSLSGDTAVLSYAEGYFPGESAGFALSDNEISIME